MIAIAFPGLLKQLVMPVFKVAEAEFRAWYGSNRCAGRILCAIEDWDGLVMVRSRRPHWQVRQREGRAGSELGCSPTGARGINTLLIQTLPKIVQGKLETLAKTHPRLPSQYSSRFSDVRLSPGGIVLRKLLKA